MDALKANVLSYMDRHSDELFDILLGLLRIKSENFLDHGDEEPCARHVEKLWSERGLKTEYYYPDDVPGVKEHPEYLTGRATDTRPNVTAIMPGKDPTKRIMLMAHTDTMPIGDPAGWTVNPLGEVKDGRIYGRGANDNKFGLAGITYIIDAFKANGVSLKEDVLFTAYADEEYGGGGGTLAACLGYPCDVYVNMDGGNGEIWPIALGGQALQLRVFSDEPLDSSVPIIDALYIAKNLLLPFGERRRQELAENPHYRGTDMQRSAFRITGFKAGDTGCDLNFGRLQFSVYTDKPKAQIYSELGQIEEQIKEAIKPLNVQTNGFEPQSRYFEYNEMTDTLGVIECLQSAGEQVTGEKLPVTASCLTDLNLLLTCGSKNSLNFGLVRDFRLYGGAHQPDEFVECDKLLDYTKTLAVFLMDWCGVAK